MGRLLDYLPRGDMVDDAAWRRRHRFLTLLLAALCPALLLFGVTVGSPWAITLVVAAVPAVTATAALCCSGRRAGSWWVTAGLTACCAGLVILSGGLIEAHFSFFVIIGFLTLYQHWLPFVWNIGFTVCSHGLGSLLVPTMIFNHHGGQHSPWLWSLVHGVAVLLACVGVMLFCRITEQEQARRAELSRRLADAEVAQQEFTSQLLLNLARRNQGMYARQLDIIDDLERRERDPDVLADLFRLDHLATRVRRNAESLLVLSGETPARVWSQPVPLRDVVRAGIAETEDLDRVGFTVDEQTRVAGGAVADLTHLLAELVENAVRFSPPSSTVRVLARPHHRVPGAQLVVVEDTGVGMPVADRDAANVLLAAPTAVDVAAARRLGFHVVARLAARHGIEVSLTTTPGGGVTAVLVLPAALFAEPVAPETQPIVVPRRAEGRHGRPGAEPVDPDTDAGTTDTAADGERTGQHRVVTAVTAAATAAAVPDTADADVVLAGAAPGGWRGLIHPVVVPPPREDDSRAPGGPAPADGPLLARRVPQTHLAPELVAPPTVPPPPPLPDGAAPEPLVPAQGGPGRGEPPSGPLRGLSRYQASREAARSALDDDAGRTAGDAATTGPAGGRP